MLSLLVLLVAVFAFLLPRGAVLLGELHIHVNAIPDFIFSLFLSELLGYTLYRTFHHRDLKVVALVFIAIIAAMFISKRYSE